MNSILLIAIVSLMIGLSKGGLGGPVLIPLLTPILSQIMPAPQAVGVVLPLLLIGDLFALNMYWKKWDMRHIRLLVPMATVGIIFGTLVLWLLTSQPDDTVLRRIIGLITLLVVIYRITSNNLKNIHYQPHHWHGYLAGVLSGFGSALANVGAPPFTAYMLMQNVAPETFVGTSTLFFAISNFVKLPGVLRIGVLDIHQFLSISWCVFLIPIGVWLGRWVTQRINSKVFEWSMLILLMWVSAILLLGTPR
jgi:uncharacterized membrane protein YfcA